MSSPTNPKAVRNTEIALTGTKTTQTDSMTWNSVLRPSLLTVYQVAPEKLEINTLWDNMRLLGTESIQVVFRHADIDTILATMLRNGARARARPARPASAGGAATRTPRCWAPA